MLLKEARVNPRTVALPDLAGGGQRLDVAAGAVVSPD
jgi:hypothetical protein